MIKDSFSNYIPSQEYCWNLTNFNGNWVNTDWKDTVGANPVSSVLIMPLKKKKKLFLPPFNILSYFSDGVSEPLEPRLPFTLSQ